MQSRSYRQPEFTGGYSWGYNPTRIFAIESDTKVTAVTIAEGLAVVALQAPQMARLMSPSGMVETPRLQAKYVFV